VDSVEVTPVLDVASDEELDVEAMGRRGRSQVRSPSPCSSRRLSKAARTPPSTPGPPSSPTAICPSSPSSKGSSQPFILLATDGGSVPTRILLIPVSAASASVGARRVLEFLAPSSSSLSRPPGFGASPTAGLSQLLDDEVPALSEHALNSGAPRVPLTPVEPLFRAATQPLLPACASPPPRRVANRRTLRVGDGDKERWRDERGGEKKRIRWERGGLGAWMRF
jgi:hypothetical protein